MRIAVWAMLATLGVPAMAAAQIKPTAPVFVLDMYDPRNRFVVVSAESFDEALADKTAKPGSSTPLESIVDACSGAEPGLSLNIDEPPQRLHPVAKLQACMDCLSAYQERRFTTRRHDQVLLVILFNGAEFRRNQIRPVFEETARQSELVATGKGLFEMFRTNATPALSCVSFTYTLQHQRSRFKVAVPFTQVAQAPVASTTKPATGNTSPAVAVPTPAAEAAAPVPTGLKVAAPGAFNTASPAAPSTAPTPVVARSPEVVLGPTEHWFMSADFSIQKSSVGLGKEPTPDADQLKSKDFFVALNYALGDLLADRDAPLQRRGFLKELLIKVQATPSSEPWNAWAVGIGLRGYRLKTILWNLDVAHPYVTVGRQQGPADEPRWRAVVGIGFDPRSINRQE